MFSQRTLEEFFPPRQLFGLGLDLGFLLSRILAQEEEETEGEESDRKCSSSLFACSLESGMQEHTLRVLFWPFFTGRKVAKAASRQIEECVRLWSTEMGILFLHSLVRKTWRGKCSQCV